MIRKKLIKSLIRPLGNKKAIGIFDPIMWLLVALLATTLIVYETISSQHTLITSRVDKVASSIVDAVQENQEINQSIISRYSEDLDSLDFYITDYTITIKTISFTNNSYNSSTLLTVKKGGSIPTKKIPKGTIIRIEISSTNETKLTRLTTFLGGSAKADVVGYAEGGVS